MLSKYKREEFYRILDIDRIIFKSIGHWNATPHLDDEILLTYRKLISYFAITDYGQHSWLDTNDLEE